MLSCLLNWDRLCVVLRRQWHQVAKSTSKSAEPKIRPRLFIPSSPSSLLDYFEDTRKEPWMQNTLSGSWYVCISTYICTYTHPYKYSKATKARWFLYYGNYTLYTYSLAVCQSFYQYGNHNQDRYCALDLKEINIYMTCQQVGKTACHTMLNLFQYTNTFLKMLLHLFVMCAYLAFWWGQWWLMQSSCVVCFLLLRWQCILQCYSEWAQVCICEFCCLSSDFLLRSRWLHMYGYVHGLGWSVVSAERGLQPSWTGSKQGQKM